MKKEKKSDKGSDNWTITHDTDKPKPLKIWMRCMIRRNMPEVLAIESESFEFPWLEEDFLHALSCYNVAGMVAEYDGRVVGFMIYDFHKRHYHILNFAVASDYRRRGVGVQMLESTKRKLRSQRRTRIMLEVRETNVAGQQFFASQKFRAVGIVRNYYQDTPEDAYAMEYQKKSKQQVDPTIPQNRIAGHGG